MNIALIGYGLENASAYRYLLSKYPDAAFTVYDQSDAPRDVLPEGVGFVGGLTEFADITADLFVRSPGISPHKIHTDSTVTTATKLFFAACTMPIIGVTGSKGKGTTASLVASILRAGGKTVWLVGNIGTPALDCLDSARDGDIIVYELSSFQLWDLEQSPETAVILMIEPEHLDVHSSVEEYVAAKSNIARFQTAGDLTIVKAGNTYSEQIAHLSAGTIIPFPGNTTAHVSNDSFWYGDTELCATDCLQLPGKHNLDNAVAAIDAAWPYVSEPSAITRGLHDFDGLPHRLKFVAEKDGIQYYDDSIATTPGSALAAIRAFSQPKILILGGSSKGADFKELAEEIAHTDVRHVILIGDEAATIERALSAAQYTSVTNLGAEVTMLDTVGQVRTIAQDGDVVLLSPACASFGQFRNYADRGDQFIHVVEQI